MYEDRYSHGHHESVLRSHLWRTAENSAAFLLPHLAPGLSLLDIGCGPGNITADLAARVIDGSVVGIDLSADVIARAVADYPATDNPGLEFRVDDVYALDAPNDSFDVVYCHQVLQHLSRPADALSEMRRVLKPQGLLAVRDADFAAFAWWPGDPLLERWLDVYHQITRRNGADADAGRKLKSWVRSGGFHDVASTSSTWTYESDEEREWWADLWADRVVYSEYARQSIEYGITSTRELDEMAAAFRRWAGDPDGIFILVHGEVLARK